MTTPILARNFSNTATPTTLTNALTSSATVVSVASLSNYPTAPYTACIERNTTNQEVVLVNSYNTATPGTTSLTYAGTNTVNVTRGYDTTPAIAHIAGVTFEESTSAIDYREANEHHTDTTRDDHCFTADTEVLTEDGWKLGVDVIEGENVWTFNTDTEELILEPVIGTYRYSDQDFPEVYRIWNQDMGELLVTAKHTMISRNRRSNKWERVNAEDLPRAVRLPGAGYAAYDGVALNDNEIEILAWAFTEGYWKVGSTPQFTRMMISQNEGVFADRIRNVLTDLEYEWSEYKNKESNILFSIKNPDLFVKYLAPDKSKEPVYALSTMNEHQARIFLGIAVMADGCLSGQSSQNKHEIIDSWIHGSSRPSMVFAQKHRPTIDTLQIIATLNGIKTSITEDWDQNGNHIWKLNLKTTKDHSFVERVSERKHLTKVANNQDVWCLSVPLNKTLVVRRPSSRSVPIITGNTQYLNFGLNGGTNRHANTALHLPGTSVPYGNPGASAPGDAASSSVAGNPQSFAAVDHQHSRESFQYLIDGGNNGAQAPTTNGGLLGGVWPIGSIIMWGAPQASGPPSGWLFCLGQAVSQTTYNRLFSVIGHNWENSGTGQTAPSGKFLLPNQAGSLFVGVGGLGYGPNTGSHVVQMGDQGLNVGQSTDWMQYFMTTDSNGNPTGVAAGIYLAGVNYIIKY